MISDFFDQCAAALCLERATLKTAASKWLVNLHKNVSQWLPIFSVEKENQLQMADFFLFTGCACVALQNYHPSVCSVRHTHTVRTVKNDQSEF